MPVPDAPLPEAAALLVLLVSVIVVAIVATIVVSFRRRLGGVPLDPATASAHPTDEKGVAAPPVG